MNRNFNTVIWPLASFGHFFVRTLKRTTTFAILCRWMSLWSTRYMSTNNSTTSSKSMWCQMQLQCCILLSRKWLQHGIVSHRLDTKGNSVSWVTVMLVTSLCWWLYDGDRFEMLVAESLCWRRFLLCWWFSQSIESVAKILNRSPISQSCHQLIWSQTSVTNIHVRFSMLDFLCNIEYVGNIFCII